MTALWDDALEWLTLKLPHLPALGAAAFLGTLGVASFSLLIGVAFPATLATWMPLILLVAALSAGYKAMERRDNDARASVIPYLAALGGWLWIVAAGVQRYVNATLLEARLSGVTLALFTGAAVAGIWLGWRLRLAYERIQRPGGPV